MPCSASRSSTSQDPALGSAALVEDYPRASCLVLYIRITDTATAVLYAVALGKSTIPMLLTERWFDTTVTIPRCRRRHKLKFRRCKDTVGYRGNSLRLVTIETELQIRRTGDALLCGGKILKLGAIKKICRPSGHDCAEDEK